MNNYEIMGNLFTRQPKTKTKTTTKTLNPSHNDIIEIIQKYEYLKNKKNLKNIDQLVDIMKTTDWDKIILTNNLAPYELNNWTEPSAPPYELYDSYKIPITISQNDLY